MSMLCKRQYSVHSIQRNREHATHQILQQRLSRFDDLYRTRLELAATYLADLDAERLERAAHFVLHIDELALEQPSVRQQHTQVLALRALHMDLAEPADAHHVRDAARIVSIGLIALSRQRLLHVNGLDHDGRQSHPAQLGEQPRRKRLRLETDAVEAIRVAIKSGADRRWLRLRFAFFDDLDHRGRRYKYSSHPSTRRARRRVAW